MTKIGERRVGWRRVLAFGAAVLAGGAPAGAQTVIELPADERRLDLRIEELFTLGGLDAEGWQAFERIRAADFDGRGRLHVLDQGTSTVHVVGRDGSLVRSLGGKGDGPGEFSVAVGMAVGPDGTVVVADLGRRSFAVFEPDGAYAGNARPDGEQGRIASFDLDGRGRLVGLPQIVWMGRRGSSALEPAIRAEGGSIGDPPGIPVLRADLDGEAAEVLHWGWLPGRSAVDGQPRETAFLPTVRWALLPDGRVAVADSVDYRIHLVGGEEEAVLSRPVPPPPVTPAHRRAEIRRRAAEEGGGGGVGSAGLGRTREEATAAMMRQRRAEIERTLDVHPVHQVVRGIRADLRGRLWIERVGDDPHEAGPVDVVDADGRYLGTVPGGQLVLPDAMGPDGLAVWVERDELDVPVVRVGRLVLPGDGG